MDQVNMLQSDQQVFSVLIAMLALLWSVQALPATDPPIRPRTPFAFMWNAPTELCDIDFSMALDLSHFHFVSSTLKTATNQSISMFYIDRFGVFPYVDEDTGKLFEDGLPQLVNMTEHRELAEDDIEFYIPPDQLGLSVLDFEEWRPQWDRNWGRKDIYRQISIDIIKENIKGLSEDEAEELAKTAFERAARSYFVRSIRIGKRLRPKRLWGYYLFPDCYNYEYNQGIDAVEDFTGECPDIEKSRNDELLWLWKETTVLYPSIYLELALRDTRQARMYVRHRIREAMRVSTLPKSSYSIPVYAFIRPVYKDKTDIYMSENDLVNTIGEAAALGAAGVVSWGDMDVTSTEDTCFDARRHLERVMNPYILNVSKATQLCSGALCQGKGRCIRKQWDDDVFLHLDPRRYRIERQRSGGPLTVIGGLSQDDINWFDIHFDCMCYGQEPCKSVFTINVVDDFNSISVRNRVADRSGLPLVMMMMMTILLCLKCAVLHI